MDKDFLLELIDFEQNNVVEIALYEKDFVLNFICSSTFPLTNREVLKVKFEIKINDLKIEGVMDRVFIHQLGKRLFDSEGVGNDYMPVFIRWLSLMNEDFDEFKSRVYRVIVGSKLRIRYVIGKINLFYGFVSTIFENTNQLDFRKSFQLYASQSGQIEHKISGSAKINRTVGFQVRENYQIKSSSDLISIQCGIVYGLNNGYGAYSVYWLRKLKSIGENGVWLTPIESKIKLNWRNNPRYHSQSAAEEMEYFVKTISEEAVAHQLYLESLIKKAENQMLEIHEIDKFYKLFKVAFATKDRVRNIHQKRLQEKGNTALTFAESLCYVGTYDTATPRSVKQLLIETGTRILEDAGFRIILKDDQEITLKYSYNWY